MRAPPDRLEPGEAALGIVRTECFALDAGGRPVNPGAFTRWADSLAPWFRRIEVAAPLVHAHAIPGGSSFTASNVRFVPLPDLKGLRRCYLGAPRALRRLRACAEGWDLANLRMPDNFLPFARAFARRRGLPHYFSLVAHPWRAAAMRSATLSDARRAVARVHGRLQGSFFARALAGSLCIAHGEELRRLAAASGARAHALPSASLWRRELADDVPAPGPGNRLLFVGRISPEKGIGVLLDALARLSRRDLQLDLVGWPSAGEDRRLAARAAELGLAGRVRTLGFLPLGPPLFEAYRTHDLLVLPSLSEGTPRVVGEAMGRGLAVLASDCGGIADLVESGRTGALVPPGDAEALAAAIDSLCAEPGRRRRLAEAALGVSRDRTLETQARRHFEFLKEEWEALRAGDPALLAGGVR